MIIREWDNNLIVTDNLITNLPISQLSSIRINTHGLSSSDLILISKECNLNEMTETGYMSYQTTLDELSSWMYSALNIGTIELDISELSSNLDRLLSYEEMLQEIKTTDINAITELEQFGKFNPVIISALHVENGQLLEDVEGYRFADAMYNIFEWKKFKDISAINGYFDNLKANIINTNNVQVGDNINASNGIFENLSATVRLSAATLTAVYGNIPTLTTNNLTVTNNLTTNNKIQTKDLTVTNNLTVNNKIQTKDLTVTNNLTANNLTANNKIQAKDLTVNGNTSLKNLTVNGLPYNQLSVLADSTYRTIQKVPNYFYFTY